MIATLVVDETQIAARSAVWINSSDRAIDEAGAALLYNGAPFTGVVFTPLYEGASASETVGAMREHDVIARYGKLLAQVRPYKNGLREGIHEGRWANGNVKFRYAYADDMLEGESSEWYPDGKPYRTMNYHEGYETGMQKMWNSRGVLIANYEVRNGRKYGLSDAKNCVQVGDAVQN
jgi:hypothetical protein